jgi:hypothetical protein
VIEYVVDEALPGRDEILARLASHDRDVVLRILTLLCPCRNACYDAEIWSKVIPIWSSQWDGEVRSAAHHAFLTVGDRCRVDVRSRRLLEELATRTPLGIRAYPHWFRRELKKGVPKERVRFPKAAIRDVPTLIEQLASGDPASVRDATAALCPDDGRKPSKKAWRAIVDAQRSPDGVTRAKAFAAVRALHAHERVCERAHT